MVRTYIESLEAFKLIQKLFGSTKRSAYRYTENVLDKYADLIEYKYLHNSSKRLNQISTSTSISFMKGLQLGSSINQVRGHFNVAPFVKAYSSKNLRRTILLYKIKLNGQKIKIEAHFYKNELFFSKYTLSGVTENEKLEAFKSFGTKYGISDLDFSNKNIIDSNNNVAKINSDSELSFSYMQLKNLFFEKMQDKTAINTEIIPSNYGIRVSVQ